MHLTTGRAQLHESLKVLLAHWAEVQPLWDDAVRRDFEEQVIEPLAPQVTTTLRAMDRLGQIVHHMRMDCE